MLNRLLLLLSLMSTCPALIAADLQGVVEHPMISRYPGQEIHWQEIDNNRPFKIPIGPVTGYRSIDQWIDTSGRVTRTFYAYEGSDRTYSEIYLNYLDALKQEGFEVIGKGLSDDRRGPDVGSRSWLEIYNIENPFRQPGEVGWY